MGDSRISISLDIDGLSKSCSVLLPADASLAELMNEVKTQLFSEINQQYTFHNCGTDTTTDHDHEDNIELCLAIYDCTLSPPTDVTDQVNNFFATTGPNSITLQSLGWFPSAKLVVFDSRNDSLRDSLFQSNLHRDEDFEYNLPNGKYSQKVEKHPTILPSQLMDVSQYRMNSGSVETSSSALPSKPIKKRTEEERRTKLDALILKLDESSKKSKVSSQVRKMLIKSRAEGNNNIRVEDRFYIDAVLTIDDCDRKEESFSQVEEEKEEKHTVVHYFFGRSCNIGHVVSKVVNGLNIGNEKMAELLVLDRNLTSSSEEKKSVYRRLPNMLPIYEAERLGYIENFDRVIVRIFDRKAGETTSLLTSLCDERTKDSINQNVETVLLDQANDQIASNHENKSVVSMDKVDVPSDDQLKLYIKIKDAIEQFDAMNQKKVKTSKVSEKVRQMLMKSKAKGNKKCHEKDRVYLEVLHIQSNYTVSSSFVFISKFDQIKKLVSGLQNWNASEGDFTILIETNLDDKSVGPCYRVVPCELKCIDAEKQGFLKSLQRIILVRMKNQK
jgi:hypothetical protein